jgi:hypothetical protein
MIRHGVERALRLALDTTGYNAAVKDAIDATQNQICRETYINVRQSRLHNASRGKGAAILGPKVCCECFISLVHLRRCE